MNYTQILLRILALNKYKAVLTECKELAKYIAEGQWNLGEAKYLTMERLWTWEKIDGIDTDRDAYLGVDKRIDLEKYIWFELGKSKWKKHWSIFQDQVNYIHNDIVKPLRVAILQYAKRVRDMHDLEKYFPTSLIKGKSFD